MNLDLRDPSVKSSVIARIEKLSTSTPALWGKMNVSQMMAHCMEQMGVAIGERTVKPNLVSKLFGKWIKKVVLNEKPFDRNLPTAPTFVVRNNPEFEKTRAELIAMLHRFSPENLEGRVHPIFGKMTPEEWGKGTWKHLDHHLRQFGV